MDDLLDRFILWFLDWWMGDRDEPEPRERSPPRAA